MLMYCIVKGEYLQIENFTTYRSTFWVTHSIFRILLPG